MTTAAMGESERSVAATLGLFALTLWAAVAFVVLVVLNGWILYVQLDPQSACDRSNPLAAEVTVVDRSMFPPHVTCRSETLRSPSTTSVSEVPDPALVTAILVADLVVLATVPVLLLHRRRPDPRRERSRTGPM